MAEQLIGAVTHYFHGPSVAVVRMTEGELSVGDEVHFLGHTSDFTERITSMEVDHKKVESARAGQEIAIKVIERAREHDQVFKVV
jgi:putative protease